MLAKGNRSQAGHHRPAPRYGGFYLGSIGGPAARLAQDCIRKVDVLEYPELGMEAVWKIEVEDFPAFVVVDDKGNDFFAGTSASRRCRSRSGGERPHRVAAEGCLSDAAGAAVLPRGRRPEHDPRPGDEHALGRGEHRVEARASAPRAGPRRAGRRAAPGPPARPARPARSRGSRRAAGPARGARTSSAASRSVSGSVR